GRVAELLGGEDELVVRVAVHEVELVAVAVEELDRAMLELGPRPAFAGLERPLDDRALLHVPELDPDLGRTTAHLDVVVVEDLPEVAVELDDDALPQLAGGDHGSLDSCRDRARRREGRAGRPGTNGVRPGILPSRAAATAGAVTRGRKGHAGTRSAARGGGRGGRRRRGPRSGPRTRRRDRRPARR